jgi:hypothetical protein
VYIYRDLTYEDVERVHLPWIENLTQAACLGGVCYKSLTGDVFDVMSNFSGNRTLFQETGWFATDGINLLRGYLGLVSNVDPRFFGR